MNRIISLSVLLALIVVLGGMLFQVIAPFILPLFLAAVLAVICQPLHQFILQKVGHRRTIAAILSTSTLVAMLVLPLVIVTFICAMQLYSLANQHLDGDWHRGLDLIWNRGILPGIERVKPYYPGGLSEEQLDNIKNQFAQNLQSLAGLVAARTFQIASSTVGMFVSLTVAAGMFITALYYFLADGPALISAAEELIPLPVDHQRRLCERFATVVRAVVSATFLAAFIQGFATAVAIQFCGIGYFWIFLAIASLASLIPLVGAWIVWAPCVAWLALQGHWTAAILLAVWGIAVVSMLDNGVKMYVLQSDADLHPLLAFMSVVGALQVLGLWGIFIGPIVASCLFALVQIFNLELKELAKERRIEPPDDPQSAVTVSTNGASPAAIAPPQAIPAMTVVSPPSQTPKKPRSKRR
ncbi:AI-2E family transporter [Schlesneria paludicola]|uniref:AI-2E family transporter n=1 Tax=Schlesneria paludicola TaxID=360056 RepID=UPI0012F9F780|nr:AI-2E family transporter [Schlesneria paludicola]